ncbi:hypothetical protein [Clostridium estertheticum]|uniref:hypothetical protein n=1 Tax=Clostridium estertheticum TaxID=238834 RepID=UPI001C0C0413|nr:hypothetical protein [Clostridium estertheticum]MBU3073125.1 hypothetical protein [Clostridium estertheticum]MBU3162838.1 hypothetical protein [Clostridium estertheticum]
MEYKIKLLEIIHNVNMEEENFIINLEYKKEEFLGSYDNWTSNDVVSHINIVMFERCIGKFKL